MNSRILIVVLLFLTIALVELVAEPNERTTKTVLRHMRVRANLTQDEAKAILEYITQ